jgi:hypothetical protein
MLTVALEKQQPVSVKLPPELTNVSHRTDLWATYMTLSQEKISQVTVGVQQMLWDVVPSFESSVKCFSKGISHIVQLKGIMLPVYEEDEVQEIAQKLRIRRLHVFDMW